MLSSPSSRIQPANIVPEPWLPPPRHGSLPLPYSPTGPPPMALPASRSRATHLQRRIRLLKPRARHGLRPRRLAPCPDVGPVGRLLVQRGRVSLEVRGRLARGRRRRLGLGAVSRRRERARWGPQASQAAEGSEGGRHASACGWKGRSSWWTRRALRRRLCRSERNWIIWLKAQWAGGDWVVGTRGLCHHHHPNPDACPRLDQLSIFFLEPPSTCRTSSLGLG